MHTCMAVFGLHGSSVTRHAWRIIRYALRARNVPVRARSCSRKRSEVETRFYPLIG